MASVTEGLEMSQDEGQDFHVRLVIAIDYGTTFTGMQVPRPTLTNLIGVAYATPKDTRLQLDEIDVVIDWGAQINVGKIPSVFSYSLPSERGEQQWGHSLSKNAVSMVNTKLELGLHGVSEELDIILHTLEGMNDLGFGYIQSAVGSPAFPWQGPEEIVTDYLEKVIEYLLETINEFSEELRAQVPVDIVVTVPPVGLLVVLLTAHCRRNGRTTRSTLHSEQSPTRDLMTITSPCCRNTFLSPSQKQQPSTQLDT
jgi:hypothetical protein